MDIGQNIRARRKELKMTLEQLALEIGSDTGNLSRIERGQQSLTTEKISVIAKALNCSPVDLMSSHIAKDISLPSGYHRIPLLNKQQILDWDKIQSHVEFLEIGEWLITEAIISAQSFSFEIIIKTIYLLFNQFGYRLLFFHRNNTRQIQFLWIDNCCCCNI